MSCNQLQPFHSVTFQIRKETQIFGSKGSNCFFVFVLNMTPLIERLRLEQSPTHCSINAACICFKSIMLSPPFYKTRQATVFFTFSKALRLQSFLRHKNLNNNRLWPCQLCSGTTAIKEMHSYSFYRLKYWKTSAG